MSKVVFLNGCGSSGKTFIAKAIQRLLNSYDFKVDTTTLSPFEAARLILNFMDDTPAPEAFRELQVNF